MQNYVLLLLLFHWFYHMVDVFSTVFSRTEFQPICQSITCSTLTATFSLFCSPAAVSCKLCPVPKKGWEKTCKASLLLKTASSQVKQISSDWSSCWSLASNMTLPVWHKVLDYVYFYHPYVTARVFTAEVFGLLMAGLLLRSWLLGARLLAPCNCRIDAPSRVPAPKCFCSHSILRSETPLCKFGDLFLNQLFFFHTAALPKLSFNHTEAIDIYIF